MNTTCHLIIKSAVRRAGKRIGTPETGELRIEVGKRVQKGNEAMTAMLMERKCQISQHNQSKQTVEPTREEALERLVHLLETNAGGYAHLHVETALDVESDLALSQMARLSAAHASYALANNSKMRRISQGAWLHERHARA